MARVSVIVPAHDAAAYIGEAIRSVQAQTYADWEVVVVDDASSDDTAGIVERHGDARVRLVRSPSTVGPAGARNLALRHATGELIAFLDADDFWLPEYLARQVGRYEREERAEGSVGIVACNARILAPTGFAEYTYWDQFRRVSPPTLDLLLRRNFIFVSALVPKAVGEEVGWFSTDLFGTEDHDLWIRILECGYRLVLSSDVLAVYRHAPDSVSASLVRMGANNQLTYRRALERGRLTVRQRRIARSELKYNRAMEEVAHAWLERRDSRLGTVARLLRALPVLAWIALSRPGHWRDWLRVLMRRSSRA